MVTIEYDSDTLERLLERQRKSGKEAREPDIVEGDMVEPAKEHIEEKWNTFDADGPNQEVNWYREPKLQVDDRGDPVEPDLVCEINLRGGVTLYPIELKVTLGKGAIGQALFYYWGFKDGVSLSTGDGEVLDISGDELVIPMIGYSDVKQRYYGDFLDWMNESLDIETELRIFYVEA